MIALLALPAALRAQTDPRGHWRTWHTAHFRVHALAEHAVIAELAAREAEWAYLALARELVPPRGIVDLVLYDNVDFANGFTSIFPRNQVAVYLTSPAGEAGLGRYDSWLRLVITHELTHAFHLDRSAGIWGTLQKAFGRAPGLFPNAYRPSWVSEGLAVYYESRLTDGGRLRGFYHGQVLASAAAANRWPAPGDASFASAKWPAGLGPYAFGSRFLDWEARTYGATVIPRFVESTSRRLWPLAVSGPLKKAGGERLGPGWKRFHEEWARPRAGEPGRVLARGLRVDPRPQVSADGKLVAYVDADGKRTSDVVVRDAATWKRIGRHLVTADVEIAWAGPDLLISQLEFRRTVEVRSQLYRWVPGEGRPWRLEAAGGRLARPFLVGPSTVGAIQRLAASAVPVQVVAPGVQALAAPPAADWSRMAGSPDGTRIAGARQDGAHWDIALWPAGQPDSVRYLSHDAAFDDDPAWTPDGSTLLFASERLGLPQIFGFRIATGEILQYTREPTGARGPSASPDGTLYYSTILGDGYAVLSRPLDGTRPQRGLGEDSLVPPFVPPTVPVRETRYRPALFPKWWWPAAHDAGRAGTFLGAVTSGSDQVGRVGYALGVAHALESDRWEGALSLAYTRWARWRLDAGASQAWAPSGQVTTSTGAIYPVDRRDRSATVGATVRWRGWRSDAALRFGAEIERDERIVPDTAPGRFVNPTFAGGAVSFRYAHTDSRALAISAENGIALTSLYRRHWVLDDSRWIDEIHGSLRAYLAMPLPGFARWVLALRVAGAASNGTGMRRAFGLGGESSDVYAPLPGIAIGSGGREFPLRGYPRSGFGFTRVAVGAAELRVPVFLIGKGIPLLPLAIDRVSLSFFGEAGDGWDPGDSMDLARYRTVGAELVTDWGLNYDSPLRVRAGVARGLVRWVDGSRGDTRWYVALGTAF